MYKSPDIFFVLKISRFIKTELLTWQYSNCTGYPDNLTSNILPVLTISDCADRLEYPWADPVGGGWSEWYVTLLLIMISIIYSRLRNNFVFHCKDNKQMRARKNVFYYFIFLFLLFFKTSSKKMLIYQ